MLLGSHVSMSGKEMMLLSAKEAASYKANTMMVYTGAPQNTRRKPIEELMISQGQAFMQANGIEEVVVHAPYIINLANTTKEGYLDFAIEFLREEIRRAEAIGAKQVVLHPGSHVGAGVDVGIAQIVKGLNEVIDKNQKVQIALETMAGKGTELGRTFEEIARMIDGVTHNDRLSVTLDTCHIHDAGYNLKEDLSEEKFKNIPKILETPYVGEDKKNQKAPYLYEIQMIRQNQFDPELLSKIISQ